MALSRNQLSSLQDPETLALRQMANGDRFADTPEMRRHDAAVEEAAVADAQRNAAISNAANPFSLIDAYNIQNLIEPSTKTRQNLRNAKTLAYARDILANPDDYIDHDAAAALNALSLGFSHDVSEWKRLKGMTDDPRQNLQTYLAMLDSLNEPTSLATTSQPSPYDRYYEATRSDEPSRWESLSSSSLDDRYDYALANSPDTSRRFTDATKDWVHSTFFDDDRITPEEEAAWADSEGGYDSDAMRRYMTNRSVRGKSAREILRDRDRQRVLEAQSGVLNASAPKDDTIPDQDYLVNPRQGKDGQLEYDRIDKLTNLTLAEYAETEKRRDTFVAKRRAVAAYQKRMDEQVRQDRAHAMLPFLNDYESAAALSALRGDDMSKFKSFFENGFGNDTERRDMVLSVCSSLRPRNAHGAWEDWFGRLSESVNRSVFLSGKAASALGTSASRYASLVNTLVTEGQDAAVAQKKATETDIAEIAKEMKFDIQFRDQLVRWIPNDDDNFAEQAMKGLADSGFLQGAAVTATLEHMGGSFLLRSPNPYAKAGGVALHGLGYLTDAIGAASMIGDSFKNMLDNGVDVERAAAASVPAGIINWYVEKGPVDILLGKGLSPKELKLLGWRALFKTLAKHDPKLVAAALKTDAKQITRSLVAECGEELLQSANDEGFIKLAKGEAKNIVDAWLSKDSVRAGVDAFIDAVPTCTGFGLMSVSHPFSSKNGQAVDAYQQLADETAKRYALQYHIDTANKQDMARVKRLVLDNAARHARATQGMDLEQRRAYFGQVAQDAGMSPSEAAFYEQASALYSTLAQMEGRQFADAAVHGEITEAQLDRAGIKVGHDKAGNINAITVNGHTRAIVTERGTTQVTDAHTGQSGSYKGAYNPDDDSIHVTVPQTAEDVGQTAETATIPHELLHATLEALANDPALPAETRATLDKLLTTKVPGGEVDANEAAAQFVENLFNYANKDFTPDREVVALGNIVRNVGITLKKAFGSKSEFLPSIITKKGEGGISISDLLDPKFLAELDQLQIAAAAEGTANPYVAAYASVMQPFFKALTDATSRAKTAENLDAAKTDIETLEERKKRVADILALREFKRNRKIEMRRAAAEKKAAELKAREDELKAKAEAEIKAKHDELMKAVLEVRERNRIEAEFKAMWNERLAIIADQRKAAEAVANYEQWKKDEAHKEEVLAAQDKLMQDVLAEMAQEEDADRKAKEDALIASLEALEREEARKNAAYMANRMGSQDEPPRLGHAKNQTGEEAQQSRAAYLTMWKAKTGKIVTKAEADALADTYGIPPEAIGLKQGKSGYKLSNKPLLSTEALGKFNEGLTRFYANLAAAKVIAPDVFVASEAEAANAIPNEVYDPVSDTFVNGRVIVDPSRAQSFRDQSTPPRYSLASPEMQKKLDKEKTITVYRSMQIGPDGKLYPPMAAIVDGKRVQPIEFDKWFVADEPSDIDAMIASGQMRWKGDTLQFYLEKGDDSGSDVWAAYNPYWHTSNRMLNDQFSAAYKRNLVTVECEVPISEEKAYRATNAKNATGWTGWHSGQVATWLEAAKPDRARNVFLSRYCKVKRIVPNVEVAASIAEDLKGTDIRIPTNVIPTALRDELAKLGVPLFETVDANGKFDTSAYTALKNDAMLNLILNANIDEMLSKFDDAKGKTKEQIFKQYSHDQKVVAVLPADMELPAELAVETPEVRAAQNFLLDHVHNHPHEIAYDAEDVKRVLKLINPASEMRVVPQRQSSSLAFIGANPKGGWDCVVIAPRRDKFYILKTLFGQKRKPYQSKTRIRYSLSDSSGRINAVGSLLRGPLASIRDVNQTPNSIPNSASAAQPRYSLAPAGNPISSTSQPVDYLLAHRIFAANGKPPTREETDRLLKAYGSKESATDVLSRAISLSQEINTYLEKIGQNPDVVRAVAAAGLALEAKGAQTRAKNALMKFDANAADARQKIDRAYRRQVENASGIAYQEMLSYYGLDFNEILKAMEPPPRAASSNTSAVEAAPSASYELTDADRAAVDAAVNAIVSRGEGLAAAANAEHPGKPDKKRPDASAQSDADADTDPAVLRAQAMNAAVVEAVRKSGITVDNPLAMVALIRKITEDYIRRNPNTVPDFIAADVFSSRVALAQFAANLSQFAQAVAQGYSPSHARIRIARLCEQLDARGLTTVNQVERVGQMIFDDLNTDIIRQSRADLMANLHKGDKTKKGEDPDPNRWRGLDYYAKKHGVNLTEPDRVVSAFGGNYIRILRRVIDLSAAKAAERAAQLQDTVDTFNNTEDREKYRDYQNALLELDILSAYGALRTKMPAEIADKSAAIREFVQNDLDAMNAKKDALERKRTALRDAQTGGIQGNPKDNGRMPDKHPGFLYSLIGMLDARASILTSFCTDAAKRQAALAAFDEIQRTIFHCATRERTFLNDAKNEMRDTIRRFFGRFGQLKLAKLLDRRLDENTCNLLDRGGQHTKWKIGNVMQMYVSCVQSDYADNCAAHGRDAAYVQLLKDTIAAADPRLLDLIEAMRGLYADYGKRISAATMSASGVPIQTPNPLYMPVKPLLKDRAKTGEGRAFHPYAPALTPRVKHGYDFDQSSDIMAIWQDRIQQSAHTVGYLEHAPLIQGTLQSSHVLEAIHQAWGKDYADKWNDYVLTCLAGRKANGLPKPIKNISRAASRIFLWSNVGSNVNQLQAVFTSALAHDMGIGGTAKNISFWALKPVEMMQAARDLTATNAFKARYGSDLNAAIAAAHREGEYGVLKGVGDSIVSVGMKGIEIGDKVGVLALANVYRSERIALESAGMSPEEASEQAAEKLMLIAENTAQGTTDMNTFDEQSRLGGLTSIFMQFKTAPLQQFGYEFAAFQDWKANPTDPNRAMKLISTILVNHVLANIVPTAMDALMTAVFGAIRGDDDKDKEKNRKRIIARALARTILGPFGSVLFYGVIADNAVQFIANSVVEGKPVRKPFGQSGSLPADSAVEMISNAIEGGVTTLFEAVKDGTIDDLKDAAIDAVIEMGTATWPGRQIKKAMPKEQKKKSTQIKWY